MAIFGGANGRLPNPTPEQVAQVTSDPKENAVINAAIAQSVQEFPPAINTGAFFAQTTRGPILPPYGTKDRDRVLRLYHRNEYNLIWQGAVAGLIKKIKSTPWEISGPPEKTEYFQTVLQQAQFGQGWGKFLSRLIEDFLTQDFGGVVELIGPGEPNGPIQGPITGIAHLDAGRCFITGNPYYPIMYFSLISGSLHRMHVSRIYRLVDMPSPDERYFGIGLSALSRAISATNRQIYMSRYVEQRLDDKPAPGIITIQGMTTKQRENAVAAYMREQEADERPVFGKTMWLESVNIDNPIKVESIGFAQAPEKFDYIQYNSLDVDAIALAIGVDRQELWELGGKGLGSGAQSEILAQKARGKTFGDLLQELERMINICILPADCEFKFRSRDEEAEAKQAQTNQLLAQTTQVLTTSGTITQNEARTYLANTSEQFKDVVTDQQGNVELPDQDRITPQDAEAQQVALEDDNPIDTQTPQSQQQQSDVATTQTKAFSVTSADFSRQFIGILNRAMGGRMERSQFEGLMFGVLSSAGTNAYIDGLREGGVNAPPDEDEQQQIENWLVDQIDYIGGLGNEVYGNTSPSLNVTARAAMWVNKSLRSIFDEGRMSANKNGLYKWVLGPTERHCDDCVRLNGQVHRLREWYSRNWIPQSDRLSCHGFQCECRLIRTDEPAAGRF